ncbi:MAG: DOMON-like domain-containing protein [Candidatus Contendobacter sp.]|nr:DOMON-like domain-containing protein [Candidatus Contendobacter sp.]MDG4557431.1 DOMON-like domain-containing protein [Candidatus Contendobacter sp.]
MPTAALICHPATPCATVRRFTVEARRTPAGSLALRYVIEGDPADVRLPDPRPPRRADELWRHTCFEAFLAGGARAGYHEFNFAPSTEWAVYRFTAYRTGMTAVEPIPPPTVTLRVGADRLELEAVVELAELAADPGDVGLRLALAAVIEARNGRRSYWALRHPPGPPDFHHPDGFALPLDSFTLTTALT